MSISQQFYLAASLKHLSGDHSMQNVIKEYGAEEGASAACKDFINNGFRPLTGPTGL